MLYLPYILILVLAGVDWLGGTGERSSWLDEWMGGEMNDEWIVLQREEGGDGWMEDVESG